MLRGAVSEGRAAEIARGDLPGFEGVSAVVAAEAAKGMDALLDYLSAHIQDADVALWGCDALATGVEGNAEAAALALAHNAPKTLADVLHKHKWDEEIAAAAIRATEAIAPFGSSEFMGSTLVEALLSAMTASDEAHQIQSTGVRALLALTHSHPPLLHTALSAGALEVVKAAVDSAPDDGQLQWRGMNLLDALRPGLGDTVRKKALARSFSSFLRRKDSKSLMGGSFA
jgi:hypothetical protein